MRPGEANSELFLRLKGLIDVIIPECFWKRFFLRKWEETESIDRAYEEWSKGPSSGNTRHIATLEQTIQEIKDDYTKRTGKSA